MQQFRRNETICSALETVRLSDSLGEQWSHVHFKDWRPNGEPDRRTAARDRPRPNPPPGPVAAGSTKPSEHGCPPRADRAGFAGQIVGRKIRSEGSRRYAIG